MTREEILAMSAGRKLDALVAKHVMFPRHSHPIEEVQGWCQCYSTLLSAAWLVVDKTKVAIIPQSIGAPDDMKYLAKIEDYPNDYQAFAPTAPLAICRCALLAVMEGKDEGE